ncbi:GreA/GreB family elongation factor, partial [Hansschlegelia beijingensis]
VLLLLAVERLSVADASQVTRLSGSDVLRLARETFRIVGEDEADPARGSVSYIAPLARALMGKAVGDEATIPNGTVEVVAIE